MEYYLFESEALIDHIVAFNDHNGVSVEEYGDKVYLQVMCGKMVHCPNAYIQMKSGIPIIRIEGGLPKSPDHPICLNCVLSKSSGNVLKADKAKEFQLV